MLEIIDKSNCCGCHACYNACPQNAITMKKNKLGFRYPAIDKEKCIDCGLCKKVCPVLNKKKINNKPIAYACINRNDNIRKESSSGGIFTLIAERILDLNGVVFGAQFDECLNVSHSYIENKEELYKIRKSKYVQSNIKDTYKIAKKFLDDDRFVLFTGTPCQVEGLYSYLRKDYNKLYTQDIICHGVPAPEIWQKYKEDLEKQKHIKIVNMNFRDKSNGWMSYFLRYTDSAGKEYYEPSSKSRYMKLFLKNYILRDSCYNCAFKNENRISDITLADFWGVQNINKEMFDNKGTSLVIVNSEKGNELFNSIKKDTNYVKTDLEEAIRYNPSMVKSSEKPYNRKKLLTELRNYNDFDSVIKKYIPKENIFKRIIAIIKNVIKAILNKIDKLLKKQKR